MSLTLSSNTRTILANCSKINQNMFFKKGNVLKTVAKSGTILAEAIVEESMPMDFGIYDLNQFLSTLDLFEDPVLKFHEAYVEIREKNSCANYAYAGENANLTPYPEGDVDHSEAVVDFSLKKSDLDRLKVAVNTFDTSEIVIRGYKDDRVDLSVENSAKSSFTISLDAAKPNDNFCVVLNSKNLVLLPDAYNIAVFSEGLVRFKSARVTYWIGAETLGTWFGQENYMGEEE